MTTYSSKSNAQRAARSFMDLVSKLNIGGTAVVDGSSVTYTLDHSVHPEFVAQVTKRFPSVTVDPAPEVVDGDTDYRAGSKRAAIHIMLTDPVGVTVSEAAVILGVNLEVTPRQRIMNRFHEARRITGLSLDRSEKRNGELVYRLG